MAESIGTVLIRADAGMEIGAGHAMRCLALAEALSECDSEVIVRVPSSPDWIIRRLQARGLEVIPALEVPGSAEDADATAALAKESRASWVVLDGYRFGRRFQQRTGRCADLRLLLIDDNGDLDGYEAHVILNQNLHARKSFYEQRSAAKLLLGPRYTLIRREFRAARPEAVRCAGQARKILVTLGGGDSREGQGLVLGALRRIEVPELQLRVAGTVERVEAVDVEHAGYVAEMAEMMAWADVAVASAGSVSWELACMGVPTVSISTAENQRSVGKALHQAGVLMSVGSLQDVTTTSVGEAVASLLPDYARRLSMSERGRALVDGLGAARVAAAMASFEAHV